MDLSNLTRHFEELKTHHGKASGGVKAAHTRCRKCLMDIINESKSMRKAVLEHQKSLPKKKTKAAPKKK